MAKWLININMYSIAYVNDDKYISSKQFSVYLKTLTMQKIDTFTKYIICLV